MKKASILRRTGSILLLLPITLVLLSPLSSCSQSKANQLDGKKFTIVTMEKDKPITAAVEHAEFSNGKFFTQECARWGFESGKYTSDAKKDVTTFESTLLSANEGKMIFTGTITGNTIEGTMVWSKQGQDDIHYVFATGDKLPDAAAKLDGQSLQVKFTDASGEQDETITFNNGMLESPACYQWGFSPATYSAKIMGDKIQFESTYTSEKEGTMYFTGYIAGGEVTGNQLWKKEGQADINYTITGWVK